MSEKSWLLITLVGEDRPGIVAHVTRVLFGVGAELGETAMMRLGDQFAIMMMVRGAGRPEEVTGLLESVRKDFALKIHVDEIDSQLHQHREPDVSVTVHSADRSGIVSEVTAALLEAGMNILDLRSDVGGTAEKPIYIMQIDGESSQGIEPIKQQVADFAEQGLNIRVTPIQTLRG